MILLSLRDSSSQKLWQSFQATLLKATSRALDAGSWKRFWQWSQFGDYFSGPFCSRQYSGTLKRIAFQCLYVSDIFEIVQSSLTLHFFQLLAVFWRQIRGAGIGSQISPSLSNLAVTLVERSWSECFAEILRQKLNNYHDGLILWVKTWKIACSSRGAIASRPRGTEENFPLWKACQAYGQATSHLQPPRPRLQMQSGKGWNGSTVASVWGRLRAAPFVNQWKDAPATVARCDQGGDVHVCQPPLPEIEGG